jgi:hypothetical protein
MKTASLIALVVGSAVLLVGTVYVWRLGDQAGVGAAAMAKVTCSCVFVDGRPHDACRADDPPGFEGVGTEIDTVKEAVTGRVLGIITRRAIYTDRYGCTLEP